MMIATFSAPVELEYIYYVVRRKQLGGFERCQFDFVLDTVPQGMPMKSL